MYKKSFSEFKNIFVTILICIVFFIVFFIFFTEIVKNQKIKSAKKNFYEVKKEIITNSKLCEDKSKKSNFGQLCFVFPNIENINYFFNITNQMLNPHDLSNGVNGSFGSVLIDIVDKKIFISIDYDANGGIDIEHIIKLL